ncbi:hypothetical protein K435DRAFT_863179, partial [Dendrothele bispora CBS 962.96]
MVHTPGNVPAGSHPSLQPWALGVSSPVPSRANPAGLSHQSSFGSGPHVPSESLPLSPSHSSSSSHSSLDVPPHLSSVHPSTPVSGRSALDRSVPSSFLDSGLDSSDRTVRPNSHVSPPISVLRPSPFPDITPSRSRSVPSNIPPRMNRRSFAQPFSTFIPPAPPLNPPVIPLNVNPSSAPPPVPPIIPPPVLSSTINSSFPSVLPTLSFSSTSSLPTVTHIPILKGADNWPIWYDSVWSTLTSLHLIPHVCDPPPAGVPITFFNSPSYPPAPPPADDQDLCSKYLLWWKTDSHAAHVLSSRLSPSILAFLPDHIDSTTGLPRTSRAVLMAIKQFCNVNNAASASLLKEALFSRTCGPSPTAISTYCEAWRSDVGTLRTMGYRFDWSDAIFSFLSQLPPSLLRVRDLLWDSVALRTDLDSLSLDWVISYTLQSAARNATFDVRRNRVNLGRAYRKCSDPSCSRSSVNGSDRCATHGGATPNTRTMDHSQSSKPRLPSSSQANIAAASAVPLSACDSSSDVVSDPVIMDDDIGTVDS